MSAKPSKAAALLAFFLLLFSLQADAAAPLTRDFFRDKPRSLVKDFYISRYLDQNISSQDAQALLGEVNNMNWRLFDKFAARLDDFSFKRVSYCRHLSPLQYIGKDIDCIKIGLTPYKATKLPPEKLLRIASRIAQRYPDDASLFRLVAARDFNRSVQSGPKRFLHLFNRTGKRYREHVLNHPLPPRFLAELAKESDFNPAINKIVRNPRLDRLQRSILKLDSSALNSESNFLLGLNALRLGHREVAVWYFRSAQKKAVQNFAKDKALFWEYLTTGDTALLKQLLRDSKEINIYTLYASEKTGHFPRNILVSTEPKRKNAPFDIRDPFAWLKIKKAFKSEKFESDAARNEAVQRLNSEESEPHIAALLYRYRDNRHFYLFPWYDAISALPVKRRALLLALARQESRFIPTAVSYSYALGMMQFMPFLAKAIAKERGIRDFRYEMMFDPRIAYDFANTHLDYLEKFLQHPLLIAYAYNGGIGYTRRRVVQNAECFGNGAYEPFMSMELLPNAQARRYGKKVLANYVVYARLLGIKDATLFTLLKRLKSKHHISCF